MDNKDTRMITMSYEQYTNEISQYLDQTNIYKENIIRLQDILRELCAWDLDKNKPLNNDYQKFKNRESLVRYICDSITDTIGWM